MLKRKNAGSGIADVDQKKSIVVGYASKFGNIDSHGDIVQRGAFKRTIQHNSKRVKSLMHHDPVQIVGRPMKMVEDESGLYTETKVSDTALGRDLLTLIADGVIDEMSIGYIPVQEEYSEEYGANLVSEVKLVEYSFVTLASNPEARIEGLKGSAAVSEIAASMKRFEKALREGSFESEELPEYLDFVVKYWRSVLEDTKSDMEVVQSDSVVGFVSNDGDSSEPDTRLNPSDSVDETTRKDNWTELLDRLQEFEVMYAIHSLGSSLKGIDNGKR